MKIAIIGAGISGLAAAYLLRQQHHITVYEKNDYIGGHSRTVEVNTQDGIVPVDTGFIVFNYRNYPNLTGLFEQLEVPVAKSDMSFSASIDDGWLEYGTQKVSNLFAQKRNLFSLSFWRMIRDILRFQKQAHAYIDAEPGISLGQCLDELKMGDWFREYFLLAMGGAIWSTPLNRMLEFPAATFVRFFDNHGLLTVNDQPQWYTVQGGSREYVRRLIEPMQDAIRTHAAVTSVVREDAQIAVTDSRGETRHYDQVLFACHADQALAVLKTPSPEESRLLSHCRYQPNDMILHSDVSFMPQHKGAWASWVYLSEKRNDDQPHVSLSYWMNRLQPLKTSTPIIVTLNPTRQPVEALVHDRYRFEHPVFDTPAIQAQQQLELIQGKDRIWYAGAWQRYGFHEDGLLSAVRVAEAMGVPIPWK